MEPKKKWRQYKSTAEIDSFLRQDTYLFVVLGTKSNFLLPMLIILLFFQYKTLLKQWKFRACDATDLAFYFNIYIENSFQKEQTTIIIIIIVVVLVVA